MVWYAICLLNGLSFKCLFVASDSDDALNDDPQEISEPGPSDIRELLES